MQDLTTVYDCLKELIGWNNHYNINDVPSLPATLTNSDSGTKVQDLHPAMRLDLVKTCLPPDRSIDSYLQEVRKTAITNLLTDIELHKNTKRYGRELLRSDVILDKSGFAGDTILKNDRFVGWRIDISNSIGLKMILERMAIQTTLGQTNLKIYIYHSTQENKLTEFLYTSTNQWSFQWMDMAETLSAYADQYNGGNFYVGYYEKDLTGNAIQYSKLDFAKGYCTGCDRGKKQSIWNSVNKYWDFTPIYVSNVHLDNTNHTMFDESKVMEVYDNNFGMNFEVSTKCDLSRFYCMQKNTFVKAYGKSIVYEILKMMSFSQQVNAIEENLKVMIVRDLEGDKETNSINIVDQREKAIKAINFDHSSISTPCLPCDQKTGATYGVR